MKSILFSKYLITPLTLPLPRIVQSAKRGMKKLIVVLAVAMYSFSVTAWSADQAERFRAAMELLAEYHPDSKQIIEMVRAGPVSYQYGEAPYTVRPDLILRRSTCP